MITDKLEIAIFADNKKSLCEVSLDDSDKNYPVYMIDESYEYFQDTVIDFDDVKTAFCSKFHKSNEVFKSADALLYSEVKNKLIFVEFKNGKVKDVKTKLKDSLLVFSNIVDVDLKFCRKYLEYIVVYNYEKNKQYVEQEKEEQNKSQSLSREYIEGFVKPLFRLAKDEIIAILKRALKTLGKSKQVTPKALDYLAELSGGDARVALGNLELALGFGEKITPDIVKAAAQKKIPGYDKKGDMHYDVISAFIKSLRGSDVQASLYYLSRMIDAGEDPKFIARRMIIFASEDIGLAGNGALALAVATFQAVERVGLPEANYNLYHCAVALARSPKSREITDLMHTAKDLAKQFPDAPVPLHIRNAPTKLMKDLGYGKDYKWQAGFQHEKGFLPDEIKSSC